MENLRKKKALWMAMDLGLAALLILLDQWSKHLAIVKLKGQAAYVLISGVFELDYLENRGSAFGLFQNKKVFLLLVGVVFMVVMF